MARGRGSALVNVRSVAMPPTGRAILRVPRIIEAEGQTMKLCDMTIHELAALLRAGEVTSTETTVCL